MVSLLDSAETRRRGSRGAAARGPSCDDSCPNPDSIVQARVYEGRGSTSTTRQRQYVLLNNLNGCDGWIRPRRRGIAIPSSSPSYCPELLLPRRAAVEHIHMKMLQVGLSTDDVPEWVPALALH
ncbi:uncharacterized protein [Lolium perenne]|uniref:uncharacterized protein isoform X2 n=1 Tax=Lolium perenne TaxID=4522 RepID=UPI0021F59685|nr:uncharacterized protein LOC127332239 isoform X3 [Lolium perenne]